MRDNEELFKNTLVGTRKVTVTLEKEGHTVASKSHDCDLEC